MFFGAATFGLTELNFFVATLLVEFVGIKADLLAEMTLSLVWQVPRGFSDFVESPHCEIGFPKALFWCCEFVFCGVVCSKWFH